MCKRYELGSQRALYYYIKMLDLMCGVALLVALLILAAYSSNDTDQTERADTLANPS